MTGFFPPCPDLTIRLRSSPWILSSFSDWATKYFRSSLPLRVIGSNFWPLALATASPICFIAALIWEICFLMSSPLKSALIGILMLIYSTGSQSSGSANCSGGTV
ncbi:hypothetical protein D3C79_871840 [compost metagenome]